MKNIAVVISISSYDAPGNDLPGCTKDGEAIKSLLEISGRFSDIHYVNGRMGGNEAKSGIADFLHTFANSPIGEIFFYFSGHGEYAENEFHYLFSNYSLSKRKQSSLENADLDKMVRALNPAMFVKIVDACHSGTHYIKDSSSLENYIKSVSAPSFKNICFMFSSHQNESSYQDDHLSYFTKSILSAVQSHKDGPIKYKNVTDYVSDYFDSSNTQTPFFIDQSSLTETFLNVTDSVRRTLSQYLIVPSTDDQATLVPPKMMSLVELLRKESEAFCTKEEASSILIESEAHIHNGAFSSNIKDLYNIEVDAELTGYPPQSLSIASWIEKNNESREFFAKPKYQSERYMRKVPKNNLLGMMLRASNSLSSDNYDEVESYRSILSGYETTSSMPYNYFRIKLEPKYRGIAPEECFIAFIFSRSNVRYFWSYTHYEYTDWDASQRVGKMEWATDQSFLRNSVKIKEVFDKIIQEFCKFVEDPLRTKWGMLDHDSDAISPVQVIAESDRK